MLVRVRRSRGSVLEQTGQWQPIIGTPAEVPDPKTFIEIAGISDIDAEHYAGELFQASRGRKPIKDTEPLTK